MVNEKVRCFLLSASAETDAQTILELQNHGCTEAATTITDLAAAESSNTLRTMARTVKTPYILWFKKASALKLEADAIEQMLAAAESTGAAIVYADHYDVKNGERVNHPLIDYTAGSVTDDFDFGSLLLISTQALRDYFAERRNARYRFAGFYDFRLFTSKKNAIVRIAKYLYSEVETDLRLSGQKQFDYVDPRNRVRQVEMERAFTQHLKEINAYIAPTEAKKIDFTKEAFDSEASVIIPVRNRVKTVKDAVESALSQKTKFPFNVIVVDNHSTDGTTEILAALAKENKQLVHLVPARTDLGIGGCWELAAKHKRCGRFAVQLDSDDIYSDENTLQTIVDKFHRTHAAMVIGSYRMVDFKLNTLPPGVIDHKEWTAANGRNNALRINGLGAPRAFYTPLLRKTGVPNTSYGEDYALGLVFSREYFIARIFDVVYLCRRWEGNSDAALSQEKTNKNNAYKNSLRENEIVSRQKLNRARQRAVKQKDTLTFFDKQLKVWPQVADTFEQLKGVQTKALDGKANISVQFNPARIVSTGAKVDKKSISKRPCFLCDKNRPAPQISLPVEGTYQLLVNPFPILPNHLVISSRFHEPQSMKGRYASFIHFAKMLPGFVMLYNGPTSGASSPDHMHFQAGTRGVLPIEKDWSKYASALREIYVPDATKPCCGIFEITNYACSAMAIVTCNEEKSLAMFDLLYGVLSAETTASEYPMNVAAWNEGDKLVTVVFLRSKHRPDCYFAEGADNLLVSPGAVDMCGLLITPRANDFESLTPERGNAILEEVTVTKAVLDDIAQKLCAKANEANK